MVGPEGAGSDSERNRVHPGQPSSESSCQSMRERAARVLRYCLTSRGARRRVQLLHPAQLGSPSQRRHRDLARPAGRAPWWPPGRGVRVLIVLGVADRGRLTVFKRQQTRNLGCGAAPGPLLQPWPTFVFNEEYVILRFLATSLEIHIPWYVMTRVYLNFFPFTCQIRELAEEEMLQDVDLIFE